MSRVITARPTDPTRIPLPFLESEVAWRRSCLANMAGLDETQRVELRSEIQWRVDEIERRAREERE